MPAITPIVSAISTDVVAALALAGYPALTDGAILVGRQHQFEQSAPPRILFVPVRSKFAAKDVYNRSPVATMTPYSAEARQQIAQRSILTEMLTFEVRCWGTATPSDPDLDFDITQAYYQQVIISTHLLSAGTYTVEGGEWTDSKFSSGQLIRDGREFVFALTFGTPILDKLLPFANPIVASNPTTKLQLPDGSIETGCTG